MALEEALEDHGIPESVNTDQGSQFTSEAFIEVLKDRGIQISIVCKVKAAGWKTCALSACDAA